MKTSIRWFGNSGIEIATPLTTIWIDPHWSDDAAAAASMARGGPDFLLITHGHQGHYRYASSIIRGSATRLVASPALVTYTEELSGRQLAATNVKPGGTYQLAEWRLQVISVPHPPIPAGLDPGPAPPRPNLGFYLSDESTRIFHAGDLKVTSHLLKRLARLPSPSLAALPFWGPRIAGTLDEAIDRMSAVTAVMHPSVILPCYNFTGELQPVLRLQRQLGDDCTVRILKPGEVTVLNTSGASTPLVAHAIE